MSKRSADRQLTKDDRDDASGDDAADDMEPQGGTWQAASNEQMQGRVIVKARRKGISAPTGVSMPAFNFGATMPAFPAAAAASSPSASSSSTAAAASSATSSAAPTTAAPATSSSIADSATAAPAAGSWQCELCDTANEAASAKCSMCDEAKPATVGATPAAAPVATTAAAVKPSVASPAKADAASKIAAADAASTSSSTTSTAAAAAAAPTSAFGVFGASSTPSGFSSFASAPTVFGASSTGASSSTFSFGAGEASATPSTFGSVPSFGSFSSGGGQSSFGSVASSSEGSKGFFAAAAPVVQFEASSADSLLATNEETKAEFKNATAERTGEEDDQVHLRVPTKVYQLKEVPIVADVHVEGEVNAVAAAAAAAGSRAAPAAAAAAPASAPSPAVALVKSQTKYVEIGSGELHVNSVEDATSHKTRARLVLREDRTKRNVLNAPLFTGMIYKTEGDKFVKIMSLDLEGKLATFLLKFKEKSQTEDVMRAIETCLDIIKA